VSSTVSRSSRSRAALFTSARDRKRRPPNPHREYHDDRRRRPAEPTHAREESSGPREQAALGVALFELGESFVRSIDDLARE
jgi:hypothetical protein